jgi:cytidyltransferase-like protein
MSDKKVIYVDGVFDLFHIGHISFLRKALTFGDVLIIGVVTDEDAKSYKRQPIIPFNYRIKMVKEFGIVIVYMNYYIDKSFIEKHNIDIVIHADDDQQVEFFKVPREMGIMRYVPY